MARGSWSQESSRERSRWEKILLCRFLCQESILKSVRSPANGRKSFKWLNWLLKTLTSEVKKTWTVIFKSIEHKKKNEWLNGVNSIESWVKNVSEFRSFYGMPDSLVFPYQRESFCYTWSYSSGQIRNTNRKKMNGAMDFFWVIAFPRSWSKPKINDTTLFFSSFLFVREMIIINGIFWAQQEHKKLLRESAKCGRDVLRILDRCWKYWRSSKRIHPWGT